MEPLTPALTAHPEVRPHILGDGRRHEFLDGAPVARDLLDQFGCDRLQRHVRHKENRFDIRVQLLVHARHLKFIFEVGDRAQPAQDHRRALRFREVHQQRVELDDVDLLRQAGNFPPHHSHALGEVCAECGHSHAPDPTKLGGAEFDWRTAWSAIMAVGLRPCTGALIVLTFAFLNGLWAAGIASVLAMSIGTAITVSALATAAVLAKNLAVRLAGGGAVSGAIQSAFEIGGALLVFLLGLTLLAASLQGVRLTG